MGIPANADPFGVRAIDVSEVQETSVNEGPWSCPKETEQVILPLHSAGVVLAASAVTPTRVRVSPAAVMPSGRLTPSVAAAQQISDTARRSCALHFARLERENLQLRTELEWWRSKACGVRREEEDRDHVRRKLKELETEVRDHWRSRVAELEAEVASLKSALDVCVTAKANPYSCRATPGRVGERLRCPLPVSPPMPLDPPSPGAVLAAPRRHSCSAGVWSAEQDVEPCLESPGGKSLRSSSPPVTLSPWSTPRAQRPPPTRVPWHVAVRQVGSWEDQVTPPRSSPVISASGAMTSRGVARSKGVASPTRASGDRPRSHSLPKFRQGEVGGALPVGFFEAFDGFYKQLMQGTKCTGPDALAVDERFEIDLSGEFPPERREAQVDMLAPLQAPEAFDRAIERSVSAAAVHAPRSCGSVHRL
uniref:Uncharacterized protein n=1 Tax=Alexandrium monilatum TaxID=311494 RepID=A0A7S4Q7K9_9DINO|mmetsp:Transcript_67789/g.201683  ORF Transcript_67789/g.201683 Transcript_67789/m.201683 type:complete len:421 (-) Transcript_67789:448-1710(-)